MTAQIAGGKVRFGGRVELNGFTIGQLGAVGHRREHGVPLPGGLPLDDRRAARPGRHAGGADAARHGDGEERALQQAASTSSPGWSNWPAGSRRQRRRGAPRIRACPLRFDVRIQAPSSLRIESNLAHIVASADLVLRGTYDRPVLFGRAEVERGEAILEGKRYIVRHGSIDFANPTKIEPFARPRGGDADPRARPDLRGERAGRRDVRPARHAAHVRPAAVASSRSSRCSSAATPRAPRRATPNCARCSGRRRQRDLATSRLQQAAVGVAVGARSPGPWSRRSASTRSRSRRTWASTPTSG